MFARFSGLLVVGLMGMSAVASPSAQIIGGEEVTAGSEIASQTVYLEAQMLRVKFTCSAVVISEKVLLTAAHCLGGNFWADIVAHFTVNKGKPGIRVKVVDRASVRWPLPSTPQDWDDIALLRLEKSVPEGYKPARIERETKYTSEDVVILAGYGRNQPYNDGTNGGEGVLRKVEQTILEFPYGLREMRINIEGKGACFGDSGGPAFVQVGDRLKLFGLASRLTSKNKIRDGNGRNPPEYACLHDIVYSHVAPHIDWINSVLRSWNIPELSEGQ